MPSLLDECKRLFGTHDLYALLKINRNAPENEVKRAYHKLSLKVHPDRVSSEEKEAATKKFQVLGKVYTVLSDKDKRGLYDDSGEVDDEDDCLSQDRDWYDYWRLLFSKISVTDIKRFEETYKDSEEELDDLKSAYVDHEGSMEDILNSVLCASPDDEERFTNILSDLVKSKELPKFKAFTQETDKAKKARKRKTDKEAKEADELQKQMGLGDSNSLNALIASRQQSRAQAADDFFNQLEQKYAQPKKAKTKKGK